MTKKVGVSIPESTQRALAAVCGITGESKSRVVDRALRGLVDTLPEPQKRAFDAVLAARESA